MAGKDIAQEEATRLRHALEEALKQAETAEGHLQEAVAHWELAKGRLKEETMLQEHVEAAAREAAEAH